MNEYSLGLCVLDFLPNLAFLVGSVFLVRLAMLRTDRTCQIATIAGAALVFLGGTLKAVWKLLYATGVGDYALLSELQFPLHAPGFFLLLVGVICLARQERKARHAGLVGMAVWKIPLLAVMTICSLGVQGILSYLAFRRRAYVAGALYVMAIVCMLSMAGMASADQGIGQQWFEESINSAGQIAFAVGSYLFYRRVKATATA